MLDSLSKYTEKWHLTVNTNKTKVVVFRNNENEFWTYINCILEIADEFKDLVILLKFNGNFRKKVTKEYCWSR